MSFEPGQIILVTGASSGIGRAVALKCAAEGATILACGRDEERLEQARRVSPEPGRWINLARDLTQDMHLLPEWTRELAERYGRFFGFVHCAGAAVMDTIRNFDLEQSRRLFDINFNAPLLLARGIADRRAHVKGGAMLFISSASGVIPEMGHLLYGATKAALIAAAKSVAQETATLGLRVNCVAPGIVETPMQEAAEAFMGPAYREQQLKGYPLGFGVPQDIAEIACFLISKKARWITGQTIVVAGGRY